MPFDQTNEVLFLQAIRDVLPHYKRHTDEMLIKRIGKERVQEASEDLQGLIEAGIKEEKKLTQNEYLALQAQIINCLAQYITEKLQVPVTIKTIVDSMPLISYALDLAFPGYVTNKLLLWTIRPGKAA